MNSIEDQIRADRRARGLGETDARRVLITLALDAGYSFVEIAAQLSSAIDEQGEEPGTLDAKALGCLCGWYDAGDAETGPRVVSSIDMSCPLHGEKDPTGLGRICKICGVVPVAAKDPATDFCRGCYYGGRADERMLDADGRDFLVRARAVEGVASADVWHTGGGCMVLAVTLDSGRFLGCSVPDGPGIPAKGEPWGLVTAAPSLDAWSEWDETVIEFLPRGTTDATVEAVRLSDDDLLALIGEEVLQGRCDAHDLLGSHEEDGPSDAQREAQQDALRDRIEADWERRRDDPTEPTAEDLA